MMPTNVTMPPAVFLTIAPIPSSVAIAFIRGIARREMKTLGNFWVDMTRGILWVLLPISTLLAVALAAAIGSSDAETVAGIEFAFHRVFNQASGRIKLAWFLLNAARYMPALVYAADPQWGAAAVENHRQLIAALRRRDAAAVTEHTAWQFTDAARRLTEMLGRTGSVD